MDVTHASNVRDFFFATYHRKQVWSLPYYIINYMATNPSLPKCYQKMVQSCKHFFIKNPIIVASNLYLNYKDNEWYTWMNMTQRIEWSKMSSNIWFTGALDMRNYYTAAKNAVFSLIPKIYSCDIMKLTLYNQNFSLNVLKFLTSKCEDIWFDKSTVMDENDLPVALEQIFEILLNVKDFYYFNGRNNFTYVTFQKLAITNFKIFEFSADGLDGFDIKNFYEFIKKNQKTKIRVEFRADLPERHKIRLQTIINEIIEMQFHNFKPPYIYFYGMSVSSSGELWKLYNYH